MTGRPAGVWRLMWAVVRREWRRLLNTPRLWVLAVAAPLLLIILLLAIFAQPAARNLPLAVVNMDDSSLSRQIERALDAAPALDVVSAAKGMDAAAASLRRGEVYALGVIPRDLQRDLARGESPRVQLFYNSQTMTAGNMVLAAVRQTLATVSAGAGIRLGVMPQLTPELHAAFNPGLDYGRFLLMALVLTLLHIVSVVLAIDVIGRELLEGTAADWLGTAGDRFWPALAGKLLPWMAGLALYGGLLLLGCMRWLGLAAEGSAGLWMLAWALLLAASFGLGLVLVAATLNLRLSTSAASVLVSPAFAYSGVTFPLLAMPGFASLWSLLLPLHHGLVLQTHHLLMGAPLKAGIWHFAALIAFALLPLPLLPRLGRACRNPARWGAV